jgi:hypothetical protein
MIVVTIALLNSELFQKRNNQSDELPSDLIERSRPAKKKKKKQTYPNTVCKSVFGKV